MLKVEGLNAGYGSVNILWDISFTLEDGEIVAILGSNGAGKTTMVRAITGTVLYAAEGKFTPEDIPAILESGDRTLAGPTVPPGGLYLTRIWYEDERLNE